MHAPADKNSCELLDADHLSVKHLFVEYARLAYAPEPEGKNRAGIAHQICDELTIHMKIEEAIFYPALQNELSDAAELLEDGISEHQEAKKLVAKIQDLRQADEEMDEMMACLANLIEHHVKEERDKLFPKARACPTLDLVALGKQLQKRQQDLVPTHSLSSIHG